MPPSHHPSPGQLADHVVGNCSPGAALLLTVHLETCPACRARTASLAWRRANSVTLRGGRWMTLRPGLAVSRIARVGGLGEAVYRLRLGADQALALGAELCLGELLVLTGRFIAGGRTFEAGDFVSLDEVSLDPVQVPAGAACVCLATVDEMTAAAWSQAGDLQSRQISSRRVRSN